MSKNRIAILFFTILAIVCYFVYQAVKLPDDVTPMSGGDDGMWAYWGGVFAVIAAVIGVIREVIGLIRDERARNG